MKSDRIIRKAIGLFYDKVVTDEDWEIMKKDAQLKPVFEVARSCIEIAYKQGYSQHIINKYTFEDIWNAKGPIINKQKHYCPDWDFMEIDNTNPEFECCLCFKKKR